MDLIIQNARILQDGELRNIDIGVKDGAIAAIAPQRGAEARAIDAEGCLVVPGLIETHIHLDKTCILDRCRIEEGTVAEAVRVTAAAKRDFTAEDIYARAKRTLERGIAHGTMRMRTHVELDPGIGMTGFEAISQIARDYAWAIDVELCVFPQEGLTNNPGTEELLVEGLRRGADNRRGALFRRRSAGADRPHLRDCARVRRRDRHASRSRRNHRRDADRLCLPQDRGIWMGRARRGRPCHADVAAAAGALQGDCCAPR
jgi:cytosine deaminase